MAGVGYDPADNTTALIPANSVGIDYAGSLDKSASLKGTRIGVLQTFFNRTASNETTPVNEAMDSTAKRLKLAGAVLVNITESIYNAADILAKLDTQRFEYREFMDQYLQNPDLTGAYPKSLAELYQPTNSSNQNGTGEFLVIPSEYEYVTTSLISSTSNASYVTVQQGVRNLTLALQSTFAQNNLDAIIYPGQKNLVVKIGSASQSGRNGILAALTGSPVVTVPIGFSSPSEEAPLGVPIGMEILGRPWSEESLLKIGYEIEQLGRVRKTPQWAQAYVEPKAYDNVPAVVPDVKNIPAAYPLGTL
jgi:Asp-tRNA(Asn)/Glu-tRNA(Gln) amidotransferase A subunit family amidase